MKEKRIMSAFNRKSGGGKHKGKKEKGSGGGGSESGGGAGIEETATTSKSDIGQAPVATASTQSSRKQRPNSGTDTFSTLLTGYKCIRKLEIIC